VSDAAASLVAAPIFGIVADHTTSRRAPFLGGLALLGVAMALLATARSTTQFVIGRLLQGVSAAAVNVVGVALLVDSVDRARIGYMLGWMVMGMEMGFAAGPFLGGVVYHVSGYDAVFALAFALVGLDLLLRLVLVEKREARKWLLTDGGPGECDPLLRGVVVQADQIESSDTEVGADVDVKVRRFAVLTLLEQPRLLTALLGSLVEGFVVSAFDAVRDSDALSTAFDADLTPHARLSPSSSRGPSDGTLSGAV
jgi:MFS family permease